MPGWICVALLSHTLTQLSRKAQPYRYSQISCCRDVSTTMLPAFSCRDRRWAFFDGIADVTMPLATAAGASSAVRGVTALNCAASYQMMPSQSRLQFRSPLACRACNLMGKSSLKCHHHPYNSNEPCCIELLDLRIRWEGPRYVWWAPADLLSCGVASLPASEFEHQLFQEWVT